MLEFLTFEAEMKREKILKQIKTFATWSQRYSSEAHCNKELTEMSSPLISPAAELLQNSFKVLGILILSYK